MYAIIETGGLQFRLEKELKVKVPKLEAEVGSLVTFDKVLMVSDGKKSLIGRPYVTEAEVKAKLLSHGKHDKVIVYKYKKRKNYRRKRGHRQDYTEVLVTEIVGPKLSAERSVPEKKAKAPEPAKKKKVTKKKPSKLKPKEKKAAKPKAKPVKKRVAKKTTPKKAKAAKPKTTPKTRKKPAGRVISRLRRKKTKE
jgi:large subunit ribosomal protein L21